MATFGPVFKAGGQGSDYPSPFLRDQRITVGLSSLSGRIAISTKVFVGNLNFQTTREELSEHLAEAGQIVDIHIPLDRESGRPRGFAFVEFSTPDEAAAAIERFNGTDLGGRPLRLAEAEDRPRRGGGPRQSRPSFGPHGKRPFNNKGSRRGIRGRKRSL